jgi:ribosome-associated protein
VKKNTPAKTTAKKTVAKKVVTRKKATATDEVKAEKKAAKEEANKIASKKAAPKKATTKRKAVARKENETVSGVGLAILVAQGMFERKAENIRILDMRNVKGASADFFVISHAGNDKQVEAIGNSVEEEVLKYNNERPLSREGFENLEWVLLDYFDVVAHVFLEDKREFYAVEELWGDAIEVPFKGK